MQEIAAMVDMRFGHGTWASIVAERAKRIQEAKEAQAQAKREQRKKKEEFEENLKQGFIILLAIVLTVGLFIGLMITIANSQNHVESYR